MALPVITVPTKPNSVDSTNITFSQDFNSLKALLPFNPKEDKDNFNKNLGAFLVSLEQFSKQWIDPDGDGDNTDGVLYEFKTCIDSLRLAIVAFNSSIDNFYGDNTGNKTQIFKLVEELNILAPQIDTIKAQIDTSETNVLAYKNEAINKANKTVDDIATMTNDASIKKDNFVYVKTIDGTVGHFGLYICTKDNSDKNLANFTKILDYTPGSTDLISGYRPAMFFPLYKDINNYGSSSDILENKKPQNSGIYYDGQSHASLVNANPLSFEPAGVYTTKNGNFLLTKKFSSLSIKNALNQHGFIASFQVGEYIANTRFFLFAIGNAVEYLKILIKAHHQDSTKMFIMIDNKSATAGGSFYSSQDINLSSYERTGSIFSLKFFPDGNVWATKLYINGNYIFGNSSTPMKKTLLELAGFSDSIPSGDRTGWSSKFAFGQIKTDYVTTIGNVVLDDATNANEKIYNIVNKKVI